MEQKPSSAPSTSSEAARSGSSLTRTLSFVGRHPGGVAQATLFLLVAIVVLQNVEPTSIDLLFWSIAALPKLVLIFVSMLVGAAAWELIRRRLHRRAAPSPSRGARSSTFSADR